MYVLSLILSRHQLDQLYVEGRRERKMYKQVILTLQTEKCNVDMDALGIWLTCRLASRSWQGRGGGGGVVT